MRLILQILLLSGAMAASYSQGVSKCREPIVVDASRADVDWRLLRCEDALKHTKQVAGPCLAPSGDFIVCADGKYDVVWTEMRQHFTEAE